MYEPKVLPIACYDINYYVQRALVRQGLLKRALPVGYRLTFSGEVEIDISDFPEKTRQYLRSGRVRLDAEKNEITIDITVISELADHLLCCRHCGNRVEWRGSCNWVHCPGCGRHAETPAVKTLGWLKDIMGSDPVFTRALPAWVEVK